VLLGKAKDKAKDQSYFLYGINAEKLDRIIFPMGELTKREVRSVAAGLKLTVAEKPESMELCFAAEGNYRDALVSNQANRQGDIIDMQGNRIGTHKGIANYTLGQRQGIGYAGGIPLYVGMIDAATNTIALGTREQVSFRTVRMSQVNVIIPEDFTTGRRLFGKIRSYGEPAPCKVLNIVQDITTVEFDTPQFAPTPGQKLVLYNCDDNIVAGGTISLESAGQK
jgi:tRNA-specific 2-thiouridylase